MGKPILDQPKPSFDDQKSCEKETANDTKINDSIVQTQADDSSVLPVTPKVKQDLTQKVQHASNINIRVKDFVDKKKNGHDNIGLIKNKSPKSAASKKRLTIDNIIADKT